MTSNERFQPGEETFEDVTGHMPLRKADAEEPDTEGHAYRRAQSDDEEDTEGHASKYKF